MEPVLFSDSSNYQEKGKRILDKNSFFSDLCNIMKNVEFVKFYDTYFHDWTDIQCMVFYMKLYSTIDYEYTRRFNDTISNETMTYMLHKIMTNSESRKIAYDLFHDYKKKHGHKSTEGFRKLLHFEN